MQKKEKEEKKVNWYLKPEEFTNKIHVLNTLIAKNMNNSM